MVDVMQIDTKYLLALNAHEKIGSQTLKKILAAFNDPEEIWTNDMQAYQRLPKNIAELVIQAKSRFDPDKELAKIRQYGVGYTTIFDKSYPKLLKEIPDAPVILYMKGDISVLESIGLSVVGSRKYSEYGSKVCYQITRSCAENGLSIISGLALGIDAIAHQAALDAGAETIGVLGCGLDRIYPVSNFHLGNAIVEKGGLILSEFPIGTPPMKFNFPTRNRIIAGLSLGTLVIEAAEDSGSLITAGLALEYNRDVFAVPGNIDSMMSKGTNKLIKEGAIPVTEIGDILRVLNIEEKSNIAKAREILPESDKEKKIFKLLQTGEKSGDQLIEMSKLNVIELNSVLTMMELKGLIKNIGGGRFKLN